MTHRYGIILMAVHRPQSDLFTKQIESIRNQTVRRWRCLLGIDGTDAVTRELAVALTASDERFLVAEYAQRVGFYRNFERLVATMVAENPDWVAFADQDDYWRCDKLQKLCAVLDDSPDVAAVSGQALLVDVEGKLLGRTDRRPGRLSDLIFNNSMTGSFMVVRPDVLRIALPFPNPTDVAYHDHWIAVCAKALGNVRVVQEALQDYVQHGNNVIGEQRNESTLTRLKRVPAAGATSRMAYVAKERWGWRVAMARLVLERVPALSAPDASTLRTVARGSISLRLSGLLATGVLRGAVPTTRAAALLAGAIWWRRIGGRQKWLGDCDE